MKSFLNKYGIKISIQLLDKIDKMQSSVSDVNFGIIAIAKLNDVEDYNDYLKEIANACDGSLIETITIENEDYIIYIEYE